MTCYLQKAPADEPVFQFLDRKRAEGKPYYIYMTAGANKFLRRYYGKVMEYLYAGWLASCGYGFHWVAETSIIYS